MIKLKFQKLLSQFILCFVLTSCKEYPIPFDVNQNTFYKNLDPIQQIIYKELITKSLEKDKIFLVNLIKFDCGGASGCYWHGEVLAKIAYVLGEVEIIKLTSDMTNTEKRYLHLLISAGLEYGEFKGKQKDLKIENEFPDLNRILQVD
jgi:hypothetical protein